MRVDRSSGLLSLGWDAALQMPLWSPAVALAQTEVQPEAELFCTGGKTQLLLFMLTRWGIAPITQQCCNYTERRFLSQEGRKIVPGRKSAESDCALVPRDLWVAVVISWSRMPLNMLDARKVTRGSKGRVQSS